MRIESKRLTFWRAFWLFLAGLSLLLVGLLSIPFFSLRHFPVSVVKVIVLAELFYILQAYLMARYWMRVQSKSLFHWQVTPTYVEVHCGERMLISIPWRDVSDVTFTRGVMRLKLDLPRFRFDGFFLKGIKRCEFERVEALRRTSES
ncbi:hypothetical protein [Roseimicrobium sp. ORNL1]|uniref:hypothetical protein n=1 Tax=Roseimicrobium sp. ORNL1 TaxID=2711231 RepID=UPI0013E14EED|nr:hypothetical protein [Roseimicrobium sp. ORNL1]QIF01560.1 hypothetical protein G5S37_08500 [Roseimicrobium sp. ORNL1]